MGACSGRRVETVVGGGSANNSVSDLGRDKGASRVAAGLTRLPLAAGWARADVVPSSKTSSLAIGLVSRAVVGDD
jgi:hypothetical protein